MIPLPYLVLVGSGLAWGATIALSRIAVSTGHGPFGLILWQLGLGALIMALACGLRRQWPPLNWRVLGFAVIIALLGTILPNGLSYSAYRHLPAGVMAIVIALVPMLAFGLAVVLGQDRVTGMRLAGLTMGLAGVAVIALPGGTGDALPIGWLLVAMAAPCLYACESNFVARFGMAGMDAFQAMFLASAIGFVICLPLAWATGQAINPIMPWGAPEWAITLSSVLHVFAYAAYVWLASVAGATFAAQSSYVVTGSGVIWGVVLLGERVTLGIGLALALMLVGVALVRPRNDTKAA